MKKLWNINNYFKDLTKLNILTLGTLIFLILVGIFSGQNSIPPIDRDEARFAQASRQMVQSNDYVNIKFQDEIRAKKPIGIYWLQAFSSKVFGSEEIGSFRVPSLLSSLISILVGSLSTRYVHGFSLSSVAPYLPLMLATTLGPTQPTILETKSGK